MTIIRFILIGLAFYLLVRSFVLHAIDNLQGNNRGNKDDNIKFNRKRQISKSIGEFVDYEEIEKKEREKSN